MTKNDNAATQAAEDTTSNAPSNAVVQHQPADKATIREENRRFNVVRIDQAPDSFDDAMSALLELRGDAGITTADTDTIGDGFTALDKSKLVNRPCLFITWEQDAGSARINENGFLIIKGITKDGVKFRITDGSSGLAQELRNLTNGRLMRDEPGANTGLMLPEGLSVNYVEGVDEETGKPYKTPIYRCAV